VARLTAAPLPGQPLDGVDIWDVMTGAKSDVDRDMFLYFDMWQLQCARAGKWKLHMSRYNSAPWGPSPPGGRLNLPLTHPELYDLEAERGENYDCWQDSPDVGAKMRKDVDGLLMTFPPIVQFAWKDTNNRRVQDTPAGALPATQEP